VEEDKVVEEHYTLPAVEGRHHLEELQNLLPVVEVGTQTPLPEPGSLCFHPDLDTAS